MDISWLLFEKLVVLQGVYYVPFIATVFLGYQQALAVRWLVAFPICPLLLSKQGL